MVTRWLVRLFLVGVLVGLGLWGWHRFFPGPDQQIRKRIAEFERYAGIGPTESNLARLANAQRLTTFFTTNAQVTIDLPGRFQGTFSGREQLLEAAGGARANLHSLIVEFLDVVVQVNPDKQTAIVTLTAKATMPGENVPEVQPLKAELQKVEGEWLINRAETVKTFH